MNFCLVCNSNKINFFTSINLYKYYLCVDCNTLQSKFKDDSLTYSKKFRYIVNKKAETRLNAKAEHILKFFNKKFKIDNNLLDIGSGYGYFLNKAQKSFKKAIGIEPSLNLYKYSIKKFNLIVKNQKFENYYKLNKKNKFDAIVLIHVIEHIQEPKEFLKNILNLLKIDGVLYIETPNKDSLLFQAQQSKYTFLTPPQHKFIFSKDSFNHLLNLNSNRFTTYFYTYSYNEHIVGTLKIFLIKIFKKNQKIEAKPLTVFTRDRVLKRLVIKLKKKAFFVIFHLIIASILRPLVDKLHKGTFLQLYIKKNY
ncbi:MAG: class I SAM-dependent methyltransferase [bacterium]|nr:class I SAM-dependent methyltransferase [bacterium]